MTYLELMGKLPKKLTQSAKCTIGLQIRAGSMFLSITTLALASTLSLLYFMQVNFMAQKGIRINQLEKKISALNREILEISADIEKIDSLQFTKKVAQEQLKMEETQRIEYWRTSNSRALARE